MDKVTVRELEKRYEDLSKDQKEALPQIDSTIEDYLKSKIEKLNGLNYSPAFAEIKNEIRQLLRTLGVGDEFTYNDQIFSEVILADGKPLSEKMSSGHL